MVQMFLKTNPKIDIIHIDREGGIETCIDRIIIKIINNFKISINTHLIIIIIINNRLTV